MKHHAALALTCIALAACTQQPPTPTDALTVVATTTQLCDDVTNIASPSLRTTHPDGSTTGPADAHIHLTCLLAPNASAHDHELTRQQMQALYTAQLLLVNGVDLEHFLDTGIEASGFHGTLGVTSGIPSVNNNNPTDYTVDRGIKKVDIAPWPFANDNTDFRYDPHVWTSPRNAQIQVDNIGYFLGTIDPTNADKYTQSAAAYNNKLTALDTWMRDAFATVPPHKRVLFTSHDAFGYLARDYDITFIGAALSDFNSQQDATAEHISRAADTVKASGAPAIFAENSTNPKSIDAVGAAAQVPVITGEDALYGDSLGPAGSSGETYIGSIVHNVTQLVTAWGGHVPPLPEELTQGEARQ